MKSWSFEGGPRGGAWALTQDADGWRLICRQPPLDTGDPYPDDLAELGEAVEVLAEMLAGEGIDWGGVASAGQVVAFRAAQ